MPICNGIGNWYLVVVVITELRAEIWDPLVSCMTTNLFLMEVHRIVSIGFIGFYYNCYVHLVLSLCWLPMVILRNFVHDEE